MLIKLDYVSGGFEFNLKLWYKFKECKSEQEIVYDNSEYFVFFKVLNSDFFRYFFS